MLRAGVCCIQTVLFTLFVDTAFASNATASNKEATTTAGTNAHASAIAAYLRRLEPLADIPTFQEDAHEVASQEALQLLAAARARCDVGQLPLKPSFVLAALQWRACYPCWPRLQRPSVVPTSHSRAGQAICSAHDDAVEAVLRASAGSSLPLKREDLFAN